MFATLICVFTLDRIGRRWTLYWGAVGQGIAMFLAGGFSRLGQDARSAGDPGQAGSYGAAAASFVFIFTSVFGATWLTVPWLYPAEIFPLQVRAKGNAWGVVGWSIGNGWLTLLCPVMFDAIGEKTVSPAERDIFTTDTSTPTVYYSRHVVSIPYKENIFLTKNPIVIHLWSMQRRRHPNRLGVLSREQPKDTRRNGPIICCTYTCKCICHFSSLAWRPSFSATDYVLLFSVGTHIPSDASEKQSPVTSLHLIFSNSLELYILLRILQWVWDAEKTFTRLKTERPELLGNRGLDTEAGLIAPSADKEAGEELASQHV